MGLEQKIMTDLKAAMLAKDEKSLRSLRAIKAAILLAKTSEGAGGELKEDDEIKLLQKLVKQRKESLEIYQQQNRADLAQKEKEEIEVIEKFLPAQLSPEELKAFVEKKQAERDAIQKRIAELSKERETFLTAERARLAKEHKADGFDTEVAKSLRTQAKKKGFHYE